MNSKGSASIKAGRTPKRSKKSLIWIGILILIVTALIQFADSKINDFQNDLLIRQGRLNNLLLYKLEMRVNELDSNQMEILNPQIDVSPTIPGLNEPRLDLKQNEIYTKYKKGEITSKEYFHEQGKFAASEYDMAGIRYQSELHEANSKYLSGSPWELWKNIFWLLQVGLILINLYIVGRAKEGQRGSNLYN